MIERTLRVNINDEKDRTQAAMALWLRSDEKGKAKAIEVTSE